MSFNGCAHSLQILTTEPNSVLLPPDLNSVHLSLCGTCDHFLRCFFFFSNKIQTGTYAIDHTVLCVYKLPSKTRHDYHKTQALCFYGTAIRANFSLVHILCMRPVYRMQCGCMPCAHQRAANNHKEQTKPDTSCQTTQQTHCAPSSSGLAFFFFAGIFHQSTFYCFNNLT